MRENKMSHFTRVFSRDQDSCLWHLPCPLNVYQNFNHPVPGSGVLAVIEPMFRRGEILHEVLSYLIHCTCLHCPLIVYQNFIAKQEERIWSLFGMLWRRALGGPAGHGPFKKRTKMAASLWWKGFRRAGGPRKRMRELGESLSNIWINPRRRAAVPAH